MRINESDRNSKLRSGGPRLEPKARILRGFGDKKSLCSRNLLNSLASQASWLNLLAAALALWSVRSNASACSGKGCNLTWTVNFTLPSLYVHVNIYNKNMIPRALSNNKGQLYRENNRPCDHPAGGCH